MWKSILKQMWNRKRSNAWIVVELLLVFCLTWYIVDYLFVMAYNYNLPNYRSVENTLQIKLSEFDKNYPNYDTKANEPEVLEANYSRILQTIRNYSGIEAVGISLGSSIPGDSDYQGNSFYNAKDTALITDGQIVKIDINEDYFKVFGLSMDNGKKKISTKDFDWGSNGIVISQSVADILFPNGSAIGQELSQRFVVKGVIDDNKRFDYLRPQNYFYLPEKLDAKNLIYAKILIRYNSSLPEKKFTEQFKSDMTNSLQIGNFYLLSIIPCTKIGQNTDKRFGIDNDIKERISLMTFFLLCIFFCVMGTFWYRISLRPNEIGLRKAIGATRINIHYSLIIEGIWLLLIITLPAMLIEYQFVHADLIDTLGRTEAPDPKFLPDRTFQRFIITNAITFAFLFIVIVSAIWFPAQKGASLHPADALHYE